jgi:hypothetical protein
MAEMAAMAAVMAVMAVRPHAWIPTTGPPMHTVMHALLITIFPHGAVDTTTMTSTP